MAGEDQQAHDLDRHAFGGLYDAGARAADTIAVNASFQAGPDSLTRHLNQAERASAKNLRASTVAAHGVTQRALDAAAMSLFAHVDEVVDDHASQIAKPQLPRDLTSGVEVHLVGGFLGIVLRAEVA